MLVVIQAVLSVIGHVQIFPSVVVVVADAHALPPTGGDKTSLHRDVRKRAVMIVAIEMICRSLVAGRSIDSCAIHDENVGPPVVVVIKNRYAGAGGLDDVLLRVHAAEHVHHRQAGFVGYVFEIRQSGRLLRLCGEWRQQRYGCKGSDENWLEETANAGSRKTNHNWNILHAAGSRAKPHQPAWSAGRSSMK